jgi:pimeloyl-ACP methyl ester carboxylesterase
VVQDVREFDDAQARALDAAIGDVDWEHRPPGVEEIEFTAPSGRLAAIVAGDPAAPRVVLVPGVTGSKEDFSLVLPLLAAAGFRAESYDLAGQYESSAAGPERLDPPRPRYDHALFVDDLLAVIAAGGSPVHLLGYSFAGTVAAIVATAHPQLVASLTLLSTPPMSGQAFRGVKVLGPISGLAPGQVGAALMIWGVRNNLNRAPQHRLEFVRRRFAHTRRRSVADIIDLMKHTPDLDAELAALPVPKLVVAGEHDLWSVEHHRRFAERIGAGMLVTAGGHSPSEDSPVELAKAIVALADRA